MNRKNEIPSRLRLAIEATSNLWSKNFAEFIEESQSRAHFAHSEIHSLAISQKAGRFYGSFIPLLQNLVTIFTDTYRHFFRMALAHPRECSPDAHAWACSQLQGGLAPVGEWIQDWYALACDGENRYVQRVASIPFVPGEKVSASIPILSLHSFDAKSWRAPAWLFAVSPMMGFGPLKTKHVPDTDSDQKLSGAHTRLLLKGMRKVFLWKLRAASETARNEETAASGAVAITSAPQETIDREPKPEPKGFEGLRKKNNDYSKYTQTMTKKQHMAFSLRLEYGLPLVKVASRMGVDRKTAYGHIKAAMTKVDQLHSAEKREAKQAKNKFE